MDGPWWWSSGQHTRLILRRSEFQSHWSLIFSANLFLERTKINKKRPGLAHFLKKQCSWIQVIEFSYIRLYIHHNKANVSQSDQRPPITYFIRKGKNRGCLVSCLTGLHSTKQENMLFLKNGTTSASFTFIFGLFKQTSI